MEVVGATYLRKRHPEEKVLLVLGVAHTDVRTVPDRRCRRHILTGATTPVTPERSSTNGRDYEQPGGHKSLRYQHVLGFLHTSLPTSNGVRANPRVVTCSPSRKNNGMLGKD